MPIFEDLDNAMTDEFDAEFSKGSVRKGICELEDGYYTGFIERFGVIIASNKFPYLVNVMVIMEPEEYRGFLAIKYSKIDINEKVKTVRRIKTDLFTLGFDWQGLRSLEDKEKCAAIVGLKVGFRITHRNPPEGSRRTAPYTNIWLNRVKGRMTPSEIKKFR